MMDKMEQVFSAQTETMQGLSSTMQGFNETVVNLSKAVSEQHDSKTPVKAMEELNKTVADLSGTVSDLLKADIEEEEAWETVRDTAKEQEKETVESWKDELNNLLVFAGLFSAVVTAFTVESYTWLQQDPGDVSNALLAQMSLQLSRLIITFAGTPTSS